MWSNIPPLPPTPFTTSLDSHLLKRQQFDNKKYICISVELARFHQEQDSATRLEDIRAEIRAEIEAKTASELESLRQELDQGRQTSSDLRQEVAELSSKVSAKDKTVETLSAELKLKSSKLEMAELNLAQLRTAEKDSDEGRREEAEKLAEKEAELSRVIAENAEHLQRVAELTAYIHQVAAVKIFFLSSRTCRVSLTSLFGMPDESGEYESYHDRTRNMDKLQLTGRKLGRVFNSESDSV